MSTQDKPNQIYPIAPTSTPSPLPVYIPDPSLKGVAFDQLLNNRGIRFIHKMAAPCPNIQTVEDNSHNPLCPICDGNGMMYYDQKEIWGVFYSNSLEKNFEQQGLWEIGTAVVTLPTQYPDGSQADFNTYDQLVIPDFTVRLWQQKEYRPSTNNKQQLRYSIQKVAFLGSAVNNVLKVFVQGVDFNLVDGQIEWVAGKQPAYDSANDRGDVYTVVYYANPVYNVLQQLRELRISQELIAGQKTAIRLPQQILVRRDFLSRLPDGQ